MASLLRPYVRGGGSWARTRRLTVGVLVAVAGATSATGVIAGGTSPQASEPPTILRSASVTFIVEGHARSGAMADSSARASMRPKVGDAVDSAFGAGSPAHPDICLVQTGATETEPAYVEWRVHARLLYADSERVELDVAWTRRAFDDSAVEKGSGTITLKTGQSHLIDIVSARPGDVTRCSHVSLRVTASRYSPVSKDLLVHRLWLVHEQGGQKWTSEPVEAIGSVGEPIPFRFRPLRWNLAGVFGATSPGPHVEMDVLGSVTTDTADDGRRETRVDLKREVRIQAVTMFGSGAMRIEDRLGETGVIELPVPGGNCSVEATDLPAGPLAAGVARRGKFVEIRSDKFFSGAKTSLVLTVEQVR
jgi:hypothetical protein